MLIEDRNGPRNLSLVPFPAGGEPQPLLHSQFNETNGEIAPDGRWLAYQSDQSGQYEIYVRPFPNIEDGLSQVSTDGGSTPLWAPNGRELFYVSPGQLLAVPVQSGDDIALGNPEIVITGPYWRSSNYRDYDISLDGERFLVLKESGSDETTSTEIILVQNWFEELKRLVPTDN